MIWLIFAVLGVGAAELPTVRVKGTLSSYDEAKICISNGKKNTCIRRAKQYEHLLNKKGPVELVVNKNEIINGAIK